MSIESLKEQARSHEQREDWRKALDYYRKAIARLEKADQPDIGLYNRVGDIFVRVADLQGAVKSYERAVDLYVEAGLHNNAIAVCKKIVRSIPRRHEVFLRMGQIRAEQGFISDARTSFLTYAERMQQNGNLDESFRALVEFCDLAPDEAELRVAVGEQMAAHERVGEAVPQLLKAYHDLERLGRHERAREVRSRILELDPGADFTRPPEPGGAREACEVEAGHDGVEEAAAATATGSPMDGFERTALSEEPDDGPRSSLEDGDAPVEALAAAVEEAEASDWEDDGEATELPLIEVPEDEDPSEALREAAAEYEGAAEDLPFLEFSDEDREGVTGGRTEASSGNEDGIAVLDVEELRERIAATPDDVSLRQRALEIAYQGGESTGIVEAFLGLAGALDRTGDRSRAEVAYRQVLQMDPGNAEATAALGQIATDGVRPPREVAAHDDYVDLGSLLLGEDREKSTRFVVAYEAPTGDEDADFARMLSQFKEKVAESLDAGDVKAHHDLGTAYKEMGLLDEAVAEFQQALRASARHLPTYELLGQTFMEMGNPKAAVRTLERALDLEHEVEDELLGIYYHLGRAYQEVGNKESALEFYDRVFALDINFADVTERLRALR